MRSILALLLLLPLLAMGDDAGEAEKWRNLPWQIGPTEGHIGAQATIAVPEGYGFLGEAGARRFLELTGNLPADGCYILTPRSMAWFAVFSYEESGHVKDDEKIDPDALLKSLKETDEAANEERKRLGMEALYTDGWEVAPHYDKQTKRLEWGTRIKSQNGGLVVNYTSRLLGRTGVMKATLVSDIDALPNDIKDFKAQLQQFDFAPGQTYAEFKQGDKLAEYGLGALIVGGAAAVAAKKGLFAAIGAFLAGAWKLIAAIGVAVIGGFKSLFKSKKK